MSKVKIDATFKLTDFQPIEGKLGLNISLYLNQKDNPIGNIDKYLEPLKDALVHSGIIHDESQIKILHVETHESDGNSRVEVHIEEIDC